MYMFFRMRWEICAFAFRRRILGVVWVFGVAGLGISRPVLRGEDATAAAATVVGDPGKPGALADEIEAAYQRGARVIKIAPGTYEIPPTAHPVFHWKGWRDAMIDGRGVTLIQMAPTKERLFWLDDCVNVTLEGVALSQSWIPFYQGKVTGVGKDEKGKTTCEWRPSDGYPIPPEQTSNLVVDVLDGQTRHLRLGDTDYYHAMNEATGNGAFHLNTDDAAARIEVGDWLVARHGDPPNKIFLTRCANCTLKEITLLRNGFAPVFEELGGGNHVLGCHWKLGPKPDGATEEPVVTNMADGIHSVGANPGPDIEDCTFEGFFLDDCIAIHGDYQKVESVNGAEVIVKNGYSQLAVGEPARVSNRHGFYDEAMVVALKENGNGTTTVTLDRALEIPAGAKMSNPMHNGGGYKIIHCLLGDTRSRGILVKGDHGLIRENVITNCGMSAISIGPEFDADESDYCHGVVVEGNTLSSNGAMGYDAAIWVHGDGAAGNREITIAGNVLRSNYAGDIKVEWTRDGSIRENRCTPPEHWLRKEREFPAIQLNESTDLEVKQNAIENAAIYRP